MYNDRRYISRRLRCSCRSDLRNNRFSSFWRRIKSSSSLIASNDAANRKSREHVCALHCSAVPFAGVQAPKWPLLLSWSDFSSQITETKYPAQNIDLS
ncbi:hypothetical protein BpHYR1_045249 [Brachionus plicatilis]|uniref:Uncharacterized protein n=1 Tax=Brachionus plicatilis TaxID=10195 RepID=A0A3M7SGL6_BRAPC|nr:hypothetical protein BpHYR1_045249 [Brachionus plicatilis]